MTTEDRFCVLGNAMNAKQMKIGEDLSRHSMLTAALLFGGFVLFLFG